MKKLLRVIAAALLGVSLSAGLAAAQTGSVDTTGPGSNNNVNFANTLDVDVDNDADVDIDLDADQDADSGDAVVAGNTTGEDAFGGNASNDNEFVVDGFIDNRNSNSDALAWGGSGGDDEGSVSNTGPGSNNNVNFTNTATVDVDNDTDLDVDVDVDQDADSGDATVSGNTTGGQAITGHATNTSSTTVNFVVQN